MRLLGSGTQALTVAMDSLPATRGPRPAVAIPAYGCYDIATAAVGAQVGVRYYDVEPRTLGPDPRSLAAAIDDGVDAVLVAPFYGLPVDWDAVRGSLGSQSPTLIEDAAQGFGATWRGRALGSVGDLTVLSFGRGKGWTGGSGGALIDRRDPSGDPGRSRDRPNRSRKAAMGPRDARILAKAVAQRVLGGPRGYGLPAALPFLRLGETVYRPPEDPRPMAPLAAALALASRPSADAEAERRIETAEHLVSRLRDRLGSRWGPAFRVPVVPEDGRPGYLRLPVLTPSGMEGFAPGSRVERLGIMPGYPVPLPRLPPLSEVSLGPSAAPGATELTQRLVTLPTHSLLARQDMDAIVRAFEDYRI